MKKDTQVVSILSKKVIAYDVVTMRPATSGEDPPMIVSIPKTIVKAIKAKKGERMQIFTDGETIYLKRLEEPKI